MRRTLLVVSVLSSVLALAPTGARAQRLVCELTGFLDDIPPTPMFVCNEPISCTSDAACDPAELPFSSASCDRLDAMGEGFCRPDCSTFFLCESEDDCPRLRDGDGLCVMTPFLSEPLPPGVCVYNRPVGATRPTYCVDAAVGSGLPREAFARCHTRPDGAPTSNWYEGDCDGDACPNGADPTPCTDVPGESCSFAMDLGPGCTILTTPVDAGVPTPRDGGGAAEDAGPIAAEDASVAPGEDAGVAPVDASTSPAMDAGPGAPPGIGFNGGGGCRCAASGRGRSSLAMLVLSLLALAILRRG